MAITETLTNVLDNLADENMLVVVDDVAVLNGLTEAVWDLFLAEGEVAAFRDDGPEPVDGEYDDDIIIDLGDDEPYSGN
jgi:hypothetical protein